VPLATAWSRQWQCAAINYWGDGEFNSTSMKSLSPPHVTRRRVGTGDPELSSVAPENWPLDVETRLQFGYVNSAAPPACDGQNPPLPMTDAQRRPKFVVWHVLQAEETVDPFFERLRLDFDSVILMIE
jgi:hypothetical protein